MDNRKISPALRERRAKQLEARRNGSIGQARTRINVPEGGLDRANFSYRVVNDVPGRIERMTTDDTWEVVPRAGEAEMNFHVGQVGESANTRAHLLRKPKDWYEEDQGVKQDHLTRKMRAIKQSLKEGRLQGEDGGTESAHSYAPEGGIQIQE